jgi:hypothetical protein
MYYWDGRRWVSTLSPDGRYRWNGTAWVPAHGAPLAYQAPRAVREPTPWTRPLQYAVIAWYVFSALYTLTIPLWMGGFTNQVMSEVIRQQETQSAEPLPPGFTEMMTAMMNTMFWISAAVALVIYAVAILGTAKRWTWIFYVILVFLGLGAVGLPINFINAFTGGALNSAQGFALPVWTAWVGIVTGLASAALFVWMLVAAIRYGPWAMRRVS